jgi:phosphatidylglycerophosphate synthase
MASPSDLAVRPELERRPTYRETVERLSSAQKSSKGGQAYSVYINRRLGRWSAAAAYLMGLTPNTVTIVSALCSVAGIAIIALVSGWAAGIAAPLLALGLVLDSTDGQLARLRGGGSLAGEWFDHMVDAVKITSLHLAVLIHLYRFTDLAIEWLLVPIGFTVVSATLFFAQLLNEQLKRHLARNQTGSAVVPMEKGSPLVAILKLPHDYGMLCWTFVLLGAPELFLGVYTFLFAFNAGYLMLALIKWYREMRALDTQEKQP